MSNFICPTCGVKNIDCGKAGYKTAREIELEKEIDRLSDKNAKLEKKLSIAVKALRYYANSNCWDDCFYNGRIKVSAYLQTAGYKTAQQALKEIEKCVKNMD